MDRNIQAVFFIVIIIIRTVLAPFLASLPARANRLFKRLFASILDPLKGVLEANRGVSTDHPLSTPLPARIASKHEIDRTIVSAKSEVVLGEEGQRNIAKTLATTRNLHVRGHPIYLPLVCCRCTSFMEICSKAHFLPKF